MFVDLNSDTADVMDSLKKYRQKRKKPQQKNKCLLKILSPPKLLQSFTLGGTDGCYHISWVTSDRFWVSDNKSNLILTNTRGDTLLNLKGVCVVDGAHTVNTQGELIYIDMNYTINKRSKKNTIPLPIGKRDFNWRPQCIYCSPFTGDLLVGMYNFRTIRGKVIRYNKAGQLEQTIQHDELGLELYMYPNFIAENNNGDVVVSDYCSGSGAVLVTERGGRYRFSYTGHPSESGLYPCGICTDLLSQILVCDDKTKSVHMLNKDGQFLSYLQIRSSGIFTAHSLGYDVNDHSLWVGSRYNNTVYIFGYKDR